MLGMCSAVVVVLYLLSQERQNPTGSAKNGGRPGGGGGGGDWTSGTKAPALEEGGIDSKIQVMRSAGAETSPYGSESQGCMSCTPPLLPFPMNACLDVGVVRPGHGGLVPPCQDLQAPWLQWPGQGAAV